MPFLLSLYNFFNSLERPLKDNLKKRKKKGGGGEEAAQDLNHGNNIYDRRDLVPSRFSDLFLR